MNILSNVGAAALVFATTLCASAQDKTYISFGSCPVGCTSYTWTAGIADLLNRNIDGIEAVAEGTKGYLDNARLLGEGELQVAMNTTAAAVDAYNGTGAFSSVEPGRALSWMSIAPTYMHIVTVGDTEYTGLQDLKGKRVGMGQPGGTGLLDNLALMDSLGFKDGDDYEAFKVRLGPMLDGLADGNIDVVLWDGSIPLGPVIKLATTHDVTLHPVSDTELTALQSVAPAFFRVVLPAGLYDGVDTDTPVYGNGNAMTIDANLSEDLVYEMTKVIMEHTDKLAQVHPALANITKDTVLNGFAAPLHPGALRYYREIGVTGIEEFAAKYPSN
ncbi:TAXI family TRAP transporter solute-binding subunit [Pacificibacter sp. AS14]|uniref:TAXI family TRAP transporter solute-binding subunit n=1 Tax=Pacificibacter sp. AS14 TaxID=3135785 RepID=UPI003172FA1E